MLNYSEGVKTALLQNVLWKEQYRQFNAVFGENWRYLRPWNEGRCGYTKERNDFELRGGIEHELIHMSQFMLTEVQIRVNYIKVSIGFFSFVG